MITYRKLVIDSMSHLNYPLRSSEHIRPSLYLTLHIWMCCRVNIWDLTALLKHNSCKYWLRKDSGALSLTCVLSLPLDKTRTHSMSVLVSHGNNIRSLLERGRGHTVHPVSARCCCCLSEFAAGCFVFLTKKWKNSVILKFRLRNAQNSAVADASSTRLHRSSRLSAATTAPEIGLIVRGHATD